ncbi:MAG: hypothetical protein K6B38_04635 [Ruminococcus sp.]|nr:hypothetical protein [Ruminococcus sp.]
MNEKNNINLAASASEELERKKMQKAALIKIGAMLVLSVILFIFSSIAWFTSNSENTAGGMKVAMKGPNYIISVLASENEGVYKNYHDLIPHDTTPLIWRLNGKDANGLEQNMGNYYTVGNNDDGIRPGSSGYVTFYVTPKVDALNLNFSFELIGYNAETNEGSTSMNALDTTRDADVINYLKGHLLLFESYDTTTHTYSGLIKSSDELNRVLSDKSYNNQKDVQIPVNIYWVWAENLSDLIETKTVTIHNEETDSDESVVRSKFCDDPDFLEYILAHPQYFMKGVSANDHLTLDDINENYQYYGGRYNFADNVIGARARYILLTMTVTES